MSDRARTAVFAVAAVGVAVLFVWAAGGIPSAHAVRSVGDIAAARVVGDRAVPSAVAALTFDYRGLDTLGEELMLLTASLGVLVVLRGQRDEEQGSEPSEDEGFRVLPSSEAVQVWGSLLVAVTVVVASVLVTHGQLSPGGGFQAGVVAASALLFVYVCDGYEAFRRTTPLAPAEPLEAAAGAGYVTVGLVGLAIGGAFLANVVPLAGFGSLVSGGTIPLLNLIVGIEVLGGMLVVFHEYLVESLVLRQRWSP